MLNQACPLVTTRKGMLVKTLSNTLHFLSLLHALSSQLTQAAQWTDDKPETTHLGSSAESLAMRAVSLLRISGDSRNHAGRLHLSQLILTDKTAAIIATTNKQIKASRGLTPEDDQYLKRKSGS